MASNFFEVFDGNGQLASTAYFTTYDDAVSHLRELERSGEYGWNTLHVGHSCSDHDEHEHGQCLHCEAISLGYQ